MPSKIIVTILLLAVRKPMGGLMELLEELMRVTASRLTQKQQARYVRERKKQNGNTEEARRAVAAGTEW